jgi:hypothetical protein
MNLLELLAVGKTISARNSLLTLTIAIVIIFILIYSNKEFYTSNQEKIKTLSDLYQLKQNKELDSTTVAYLNNLKEKVITERSVQEYLTDYVSSIFNPFKKSVISDRRNAFLQFLTSSYFRILCIFAIPVTKTNHQTVQAYRLYTDLKTFFTMLILGIANAFLFNLIPILWSPVINYCINIFLQWAEVRAIIRLREYKKENG